MLISNTVRAVVVIALESIACCLKVVQAGFLVMRCVDNWARGHFSKFTEGAIVAQGELHPFTPERATAAPKLVASIQASWAGQLGTGFRSSISVKPQPCLLLSVCPPRKSPFSPHLDASHLILFG